LFRAARTAAERNVETTHRQQLNLEESKTYEKHFSIIAVFRAKTKAAAAAYTACLE